MRQQVVGVNPNVLRWARERAGKSVADVARAMKKPPATVDAWEAGETAPTYRQLEDLAYKVFKRPVAVFFFPEPPPEPTAQRSFRTLPDAEIETLSSQTLFRVREARALQASLRELYGDQNPSARPILQEIASSGPRSAPAVAARVRKSLGVSVDRQTREWRTSAEAFKGWRSALEDTGVFVFKESFKQRSVSGFCLHDDAFPLIVVNNGSSLTRQAFTLFHELGHLLSGTSGVTMVDDRFVEELRGSDRSIEVFCNELAAEVLVPGDDFRLRSHGVQADDPGIARLAETYKVSRETILRRLLNLGRVTQTFYEAKAKEWRQDFERSRKQAGGGDYYATKATYLSPTYFREVFSRYYQGRIPLDRVAEYLGVKSASVAGLEQVLLESAV